MRFLVLIIGLLGAALATGGQSPSLAQAASRCDSPHGLLEDDARLPVLAQRLQQHAPVTVLVIGGASSAGSAPDNSYPYFLAAALRRHHPDTRITVINESIAGETAEEMAARFPKDVYPRHAALVIWETGTVNAVRGESIDGFVDTLTQGIADIEAHDSEIMLMDMQYNPSTVSVINFEPYLDALRQTAQLQGVYVFRRFDIMKYWNDAGAFDFVNVPKEKKAALAREFYECLGERLADAIDFATQ